MKYIRLQTPEEKKQDQLLFNIKLHLTLFSHDFKYRKCTKDGSESLRLKWNEILCQPLDYIYAFAYTEIFALYKFCMTVLIIFESRIRCEFWIRTDLTIQ